MDKYARLIKASSSPQAPSGRNARATSFLHGIAYTLEMGLANKSVLESEKKHNQVNRNDNGDLTTNSNSNCIVNNISRRSNEW